MRDSGPIPELIDAANATLNDISYDDQLDSKSFGDETVKSCVALNFTSTTVPYVGREVGCSLGCRVGCRVGLFVGCPLGRLVGCREGWAVGRREGREVG